jgi:hypothetical protein
MFGNEVALAPPGPRDVVLLSGSAGRIWAILDMPRLFAELIESFGDAVETPHDVSLHLDRIPGDLIGQDLVEEVSQPRPIPQSSASDGG